MERPDIRWARILKDYFQEFGLSLPYNPAIINVGCGENVKWNYLGLVLYLSLEGLGRPFYLGVDRNEKALRGAWNSMRGLVHLVVGDAVFLSSMLKNSYDLAIFEHPDISTSPDGARKWRKIFKQTKHILKSGGYLLLTSFWLNDHVPATYNIEREGFSILHNGKNRYPGRQFDRASTGEELIYDKYILIAKRAD